METLNDLIKLHRFCSFHFITYILNNSKKKARKEKLIIMFKTFNSRKYITIYRQFKERKNPEYNFVVEQDRT